MTFGTWPISIDVATRRAQIFPTLSPPQIARMAAFGREESFESGAIVWQQGDAGVPMFVVLEGQLEVVHPDGGTETPVIVHDPGAFTGEMAMLLGRRALVRARAKGRLRVLRLEQDRLRALIQADADLSELIMRAFILRRVALLSEGWGDALMIGSRDSAATLELQAFLVRNGQPFRYVDVDRDRDVQTMLDQFHVGIDDIPILICRGEHVLRHPTNAEVADELGFNAAIAPQKVFDVVVCGAGPGGLAAAVYGASEGLDVLLVEASSPGGQAGSSSKIENYLGFPTGISGQALSGRAVAQAEKFGARMVVARGACALHCEEVPIRLELEGGESIHARAVIIATGARYRKLDVADLPRFEGVGVYYSATFVESQRCGTEEVAVVGGGNSAGQAASYLARTCQHVHIFVRGPDLADSMSRYLIQRIEHTPNITLHRRTQIVAMKGAEHLEEITWRDAGGAETTRAVRHVFSMTGASPNTDWVRGCVELDDNGFILTGNDLAAATLERCRWPLARPPHVFETSRPRIFAIGDVRANSVKRVASAVGEGSVCIQLVHRVLAEG
jgi:thioredoxin reductase (NADPH)